MDFSELNSIPIFARYIPSFPPDLSTMSTLTASVTHDHTPGNKTELLNHMFVLVLVRSDGTLFDATSIQEEDIVELCVEVGQTHP